MMLFALLLAVLSIWDYPARQPAHERLSRQFIKASRAGDTVTMEKTTRRGVELLPDDPVWRYNRACALAYFEKRGAEALDTLEKAIDLGFRDVAAIRADADLKRLANEPRYEELLEYAKEMKSRPLLIGPLASVDATGVFGRPVALGEQNLNWNFEIGCFEARLKLAPGAAGGNVGDLYMNRDGAHSQLGAGEFPGLTHVRLDAAGRARGMDIAIPNMLFPYPVFGNSSRAYTQGIAWRSIPRTLMTIEAGKLRAMAKFYLSNQIWFFPSNADTPPVGTHGDVFSSIAPYWITTAGRSYSDLPYLRAALEASRALKPDVKAEIVRRGLLAPTLQVLMRKSLKGVTNEVAYLTPRAHPSAMPPNGLDVSRLVAQAKALETSAIPPLALVLVTPETLTEKLPAPELVYGSSLAWSFVLRSEREQRVFRIKARGAEEFAFVQTHGSGVSVQIKKEAPDVACVQIDRRGLSPTNRVDITVCGRNAGTGWGAPSYVSFAWMDASAPYSDPVLTLVPKTADGTLSPSNAPAAKAP